MKKHNEKEAGIKPAFPPPIENDTWLTAEEVSAASGLTAKTISDYRSHRSRRFGPPFHKFGRRVFYLQSEVIAWLDGEAEKCPKPKRPFSTGGQA